MKIAVEGCAHGELEKIYETIKKLEEQENINVDLLICCGDFQSSRNEADLRCMAIPPKYYNICSFYKYYTGEKEAPILTVFIGGNHEASNYLQELPYGGWVAPNIYYMGYANVINIGGIRIGGLSGIYKSHDYLKGHFETSPYNEHTKRSVYHVRNLDVFRMKQVSGDVNIFLSHDWPTRITNHGNKEKLIRLKRFLKDDIESEQLGSKPSEELLNHLKPDYWFSAHLHCKFAALVPHGDSGKATKFLALDKCLPKRRFLQIVDVPHDPDLNLDVKYDLEWLTILFLTNHLLTVKETTHYMPGPDGNERHSFTPTQQEMGFVLEKFNNDLTVPKNFVKTAPGYAAKNEQTHVSQPKAVLNPQTVSFCEKLGIDDPVALIFSSRGETCDVGFEVSLTDGLEKTDDSVTPTKTKFCLNLPEPVNNTDVSLEEDEKSVDVGVKNDEIIATPVIDEEKICTDSENIGDENSTKIHNEAPLCKKFKRRNASIYNVDDV